MADAILDSGLLEAGIEDGVGRDRDGLGQLNGKLYVYEHVGPEQKAGVFGFDAHLEGSRGPVENREDLAYCALKSFFLVGESDLRLGARLEMFRFALENIRQDPDGLQVGDPVPLGAFFEALAG